MVILLYCLAIMVFSLLGGGLPLLRRITHVKLQVYLSLSAGAMLGAAFFHMLPESAELAGPQFGSWLALGVIGLYMVERFLSPHSHETGAEAGDEADHAHQGSPQHPHPHQREPASREPERHAAPPIAGWSAFAGLSIHTLLGGMALGSAVLGHDAPAGLGLAVFLATVLHKPADALTISTLLIKSGTRRPVALVAQVCFALLIPLGVALFYTGQSLWSGHLDTAFTGCVLAFSAGTFVCIAMSDLLPEVQFHSHDRARLFLAVIFGAALMWATSLIEPAHAHDHDEHEPVTPAAAVRTAL